MPLLERETYLTQLRELLDRAAAGHGQFVLLSGEAGIGKSSLVEQFVASVRPEIRAEIIPCDGLTMPGPFGPLFDIAQALGPEVEAVLQSQAPRDRIFRTVLDALKHTEVPNVLVGEDAHWSDEATLEFFRYLGRRIGTTHTLFIVTFRDDSLDAFHPMRRVIGDLVNEQAVTRMLLPSLSVEAVRTLVAETDIDPVSLHDRTGGNAFYVTESIASHDSTLPNSVREAVMGRASQISAESRAVLDAASAIGVIVDPELLTAVIGAPIADAVDECMAAGMFQPSGDRIAFRHGMTRDVFLGAMSISRRRDIHRRILRILEESDDFSADQAHMAHHSEEANDREAVLRHAQAAAEYARSFGAHREAAAQFERVLRFGQRLPDTNFAELLESRSYECFLTGQLDEAISELHRAIKLRKSTGEVLRTGDNLRQLSRYYWIKGLNDEANQHGQEALTLLETCPPGAELARAYSHMSQLKMLANDNDGAVHWGERAIELATSIDLPAILAHALLNVGTVRMIVDEPGGKELVARSLRIALDNELHDDVSRVYTNLAYQALEHLDLDSAATAIAEGLEFTECYDLRTMGSYLAALRSQVNLFRGNWDEAEAEALQYAFELSAPGPTRIVALTCLGRLQARRGEDSQAVLDEALVLAEKSGELLRLGPVRVVRAETAWLAGNHELAIQEASAEYDRAVASRGWLAGQLGIWLARCGVRVEEVATFPAPFALEIQGDGQAAGADWKSRGFQLEAARALASTRTEENLLAALTIADQLGAKADKAIIIKSLRDIGAVRIPRGPRPETQANVAYLTARELEVLAMLAVRQSNREIATALFLSPRTVGHHVSAILGKLGVASRTEVAARVQELDLLPDR